MVQFRIVLLLAAVLGTTSAQFNDFWDGDDAWWSQEAADDDLGLVSKDNSEVPEGNSKLDTFDNNDYDHGGEVVDDTSLDDVKLALAASPEDNDDKFDDDVAGDENQSETEESIEETKTADETENLDKAVEHEIEQFRKELSDSDDDCDDEKPIDDNDINDSHDDDDVKDEEYSDNDDNEKRQEDENVFEVEDQEQNEDSDQISTEVKNDEVSGETNEDEAIKDLTGEVIEDQDEGEVDNLFEENKEETNDEESLHKLDNDIFDDNSPASHEKDPVNEDKIEEQDKDVDTVVDDNGEQMNSDEDTVDKVYKDLHEDLQNLFDTWDKLDEDPLNEDDNVQEYEEKYGRPFRENNILSQREDYQSYDENVDLNIDSNLKEIFAEHDADKTENKDVKNELEDKNILETTKLDAIEEGQIYDNDGIVADEVSKTSNTETASKIVKNEASSLIQKIDVEELSPDQYNDLIRQFKASHAEELDTQREDFGRSIAPVHITMSPDSILEITSPNYPNAYPTNNIVDWIIEGEGMGVEVNITDLAIRGAQGDYLLIKPGGADETGHEGLVLTFHLNEPRLYRFTDVDRLFVRFVSGGGLGFLRGFSMSVQMIWPLDDYDDDEEAPAPEALLPEPPGYHTVHLGGMTLQDFSEIEDEFRRLVADMSVMYINTNGIDMGINSTLETINLRSTLCNRNWPDFETCVQITFGIPLVLEDEETTRLTAEDLKTMWETYASRDPFAARLRQMGLAEYAVPYDNRVLTMWFVLATGVVVCSLLLGLLLWRFSCFEDYTRMKLFSDTDSIRDEKRNLDLYPTPHQTLPPLYAEDFKWADAAYDDTARVDLGGIANTSYARDELLDIDSDEDVTSPRDRSSFSPREIYNV